MKLETLNETICIKATFFFRSSNPFSLSLNFFLLSQSGQIVINVNEIRVDLSMKVFFKKVSGFQVVYKKVKVKTFYDLLTGFFHQQ